MVTVTDILELHPPSSGKRMELLEYAIVWLMLGLVFNSLLFVRVWWVTVAYFGAWLFAYLHYDLKWYHLANLSNISKRKSYYDRHIKIKKR